MCDGDLLSCLSRTSCYLRPLVLRAEHTPVHHSQDIQRAREFFGHAVLVANDSSSHRRIMRRLFAPGLHRRTTRKKDVLVNVKHQTGVLSIDRDTSTVRLALLPGPLVESGGSHHSRPQASQIAEISSKRGPQIVSRSGGRSAPTS